MEPPASKRVAIRLDIGVKRTVERLIEAGIETNQSCEGGPGHAYPEPTIAFAGSQGDGMRALGLCITWGLPVSALRQVWNVLDTNVPTGPHWELVFKRRPG